ncbi:hypothetical protein DCS_06044 [Drechmeria coniospora]|uniref:Uncharacterized protein n=1 Tax=Drechmeria coniospora TaxID=98403 RepID=A0A151GAI2_DRECN|nr:hypothetical protein DCS_06044 [Drechmeria coniospora]KYK54088.1 hypothetical protein DCS_06044 [Drechmeria coniospora]
MYPPGSPRGQVLTVPGNPYCAGEEGRMGGASVDAAAAPTAALERSAPPSFPGRTWYGGAATRDREHLPAPRRRSTLAGKAPLALPEQVQILADRGFVTLPTRTRCRTDGSTCSSFEHRQPPPPPPPPLTQSCPRAASREPAPLPPAISRRPLTIRPRLLCPPPLCVLSLLGPHARAVDDAQGSDGRKGRERRPSCRRNTVSLHVAESKTRSRRLFPHCLETKRQAVVHGSDGTRSDGTRINENRQTHRRTERQIRNCQ